MVRQIENCVNGILYLFRQFDKQNYAALRIIATVAPVVSEADYIGENEIANVYKLRHVIVLYPVAAYARDIQTAFLKKRFVVIFHDLNKPLTVYAGIEKIFVLFVFVKGVKVGDAVYY